MNREDVQRHLYRAIAEPSTTSVTRAVAVLFDYIDTKATGPTPFVGESGAMEMFRAFVRQNAEALRMVASWGDGECGALHDVLREELQGWDARAGCSSARITDSKRATGSTPLFAEDGGIDP